jgi:hypothetical protein
MVQHIRVLSKESPAFVLLLRSCLSVLHVRYLRYGTDGMTVNVPVSRTGSREDGLTMTDDVFAPFFYSSYLELPRIDLFSIQNIE